MSDVVELTLKNGGSVYIKAENEFPAMKTRASNSEAPEQGMVQESFELVSSSLAAVAQEIEEKISSLPNKPNKVVVELSANVEASGSIFIANGTAQGAIKLQMTWES